MDHRRHTPIQKTKRPKITALAALLVAVSLPYVLVKTFDQKRAADSTPPQSIETLNQTIQIPLPKTPAYKKETPLPKENGTWKLITTQEGDSLSNLFKKFDISHQTLHKILDQNPNAKILANLKPGQKIKFLIQNQSLEKLIFPLNSTQSLVISREGNKYRHQINSRKMTSHQHYVTATVQGSLYGTAKRMNISYKLIQQMSDIFNWDLNFSKDVRAGDQFTIVYQAYFIENQQVGTGEIIAVAYTNRGKTYRAIRHQHQDGQIGYYTPEGSNLKKAFIRYPVKYSHISSTFSLSRYHPILKRKRPHKGVDLAAPIGTPVRAVGDGRIASIGRDNGYGNTIKITHNQTYSTLYAHMLKFQKGLSQGDRVKKGQVIGYVGQTGLATGPHCHYEFHINQHPKNPTTVDLPRASSIPDHELAVFSNQASTMFAQMKLFEDAYLATNHRKKTCRNIKLAV